MKICYIADATSVHIINWVKYFAQLGYEIYLITDTKNQIEGIKILYVGECLPKIHIPLFSATYQILKKAKKIRTLLKFINPDILHAHYATNYGYLAAKTKFHPLILTCHGSDILIDPYRTKLEHHFVKKALKSADIITLPSQEMKNKVIDYGINEKNIKTIQYGIDISKFNFEFNLQTPVRIISTRHLTKKYRIDVLIKALSKINGNIVTKIIGDGDARDELEKLSSDLKIQGKIKFLGTISNNQISKYYQESQIYVTTSPTDGLSIALLEAFASGCYPILPDNLSNKYVQEMGFNIEFYKINNPESLAKKLTLVLDKLQSIKQLTIKNRELVEKLFSREKNLNTFNKIYESFKQ